ncbi:MULTISPECIES: AAA family ATPase [unclassified Flavobacterium]|uniref:AAA family ATPase n=4 Tax=Flavobacterium TaxID=237 RepID=UPI0025C45DAD|nr:MULTISPECIES: AAA family ATPase [unclassified Flavobacterium]
MSVINQYITFLKEYKKLLERGVKDVLSKSLSSNFIWIDEIQELVKSDICNSNLANIFLEDFEKQSIIFSLAKPKKPIVKIPNNFLEIIEFDEAKNKFSSINNDDEELIYFQNSEKGKIEIDKIKVFEKNKSIYSKFYRAYNDIKNDSNLEIVLSLALMQFSKNNNNKNISKVNQHLFHFPLNLDINSNNEIKIKFSESENPYSDFFFLNNTPIEKDILSNIVDSFESKVLEFGCDFIYEDDLKKLISKSIQKISDNSEFQDSILKPQSDFYKEDFFKISFSPAINFKTKKPRFFEKLTDSIIEYNEENENESKLLNLLIRNPDNEHNNSYPKSNYFIDDLYENYKENANSLNAEEDFSVFFPLPYNNEQKQIYENYLKNRLTVVTGPPGTGKSHTIVNILCSLLAQGKRVLVTAQTDKALESLLDKIPKTFDDLIFTKIELETDKTRFSLENSISKISSILTDNFYLNIESKIKELNNLKSDYVNLKSKIINALEREYNEITINETFSNLRAYQIVDKIEKKDSKEWNWIKDNLSIEQLNDFDKLKKSIFNYNKYRYLNTNYNQIVDFDLNAIYKKLKTYDFSEFLEIQKNIQRLSDKLKIKEELKDKFLSIDLSKIIETLSTYSNVEIVLKKQNDIDVLLKKLKQIPQIENITTNVTFSNIVNNETKYLLDIETYFSFISDEKVGFFKRLDSKFKKISYLEDVTINGIKTNSKQSITKLKEFINTICLINRNFYLLKNNGYSFEYDDKADIESKLEILKETISKVERNNELVKKIQFETNIIEFSKFVNIDKFEIEELTEKAIEYKDDFDEFKKLEFQFKNIFKSLVETSLILENSKIKKDFGNLLPIQEIVDKDTFENFFVKLEEINNQLNLEKLFIDSKDYLKVVLPLTFEKINEISFEFITKENFEFANANFYLVINEFIDIQKTKEELAFINKKIYGIKCDILFDLAKDNFRNKFDENEINDFINLLEQYKYNLNQSNRKIRNQTQYQILARKNSVQISKKLSCWVMKFNDVLNSVGNEPEIFDCIIVDEASQLDFNSLLLGYYTENMIIVGDDKQTSPSSLTGADGNDFEAIKNKHLDFLDSNIIHIKSDNSLFTLSKMIAGNSNLELKEHFRCVPELIEFSKFNFYNNSLRPLKQINGNRLQPKVPVFIDGAFTEEKIVHKEIEQIKAYLRNILTDEKYSNKTIGVVSLGLTKHTEKLKDIKEDLANEFGKDKIDKHKLIIEDSPKFQGDERDVMLVSLGVATDFEKLKKNENAKPRAIISDQDEFKKINVALSRAKEQMILFHSVKSEHLNSQDFRNKILNFFYEEVKPIEELKLDYYNEIRNLHNTPTPFDSWFEYDIASELIGKGYSYIEPQYKVKEDETYYNHKTNKQSYVNFKLDLVVHNNGKRVAIECDGDPFHSLPVDVAYDIERQEFLERVGWKVYRILYSAYKRNPSNEIEKMINFITKNTKKDEVKLFIPSVRENIIEEIDYDEFENEEENGSRIPIENSNKTYQHKSLIDLMQDEIIETENNLFTIKENIEDKILRYFNLFENGTYKLQENPENFCLHSLPISKKYRNGYLLQCYDNGHINKVYVKTLLDKRIDYNYSNGKNPNAKIQYLKLIEDDAIIGLKFNKGKEIIFKAHKTENISNREQLHLQGYKVIYQSFENIEYKVFPKNISDEINRLTYESFNANGKQTNNKNYENEWNIIQKFMPNITKK